MIKKTVKKTIDVDVFLDSKDVCNILEGTDCHMIATVLNSAINSKHFRDNLENLVRLCPEVAIKLADDFIAVGEEMKKYEKMD